jgi:thiamine-monophosphate kinase
MATAFVEDAAQVGTTLVGGNVSRGPVLSITVIVIGRAVRRVLLRSGAHPGDSIVVTGTPGDAAAGVALLRNEVSRGALVEAYKTPPLRIDVAARLARGSDVTAMLDVSDGLVQDMGHICEASDVYARLDLDRLPLSAAIKRSAPELSKGKKKVSPIDLALYGGEDYELLMTVGRGDAGVARVVSACKRSGLQATVIGTVAAGGGRDRVADADGNVLAGGWDHLGIVQ